MDEIRTKVFSAFLPASWQISAKTKDITTQSVSLLARSRKRTRKKNLFAYRYIADVPKAYKVLLLPNTRIKWNIAEDQRP